MGIQVKTGSKNLTEPLIINVIIKGKLIPQDYSILVTELENSNEKRKIRIFVKLTDFDGWTVGALWQDTEFAAKRFKNIERVAVVGDKYRAKGAFLFCRPFITATIRYYDFDNIEDSKQWIWEGCETNDGS